MSTKLSTKSLRTWPSLAALLPFALTFACGPDGGGQGESPIEEHVEVKLGSDAAGGGKLTAEFDFDRAIALFFDECLGGSGDDCEGGTLLYSAANPGFSALESDEPGVGLVGEHHLADGRSG